jgi:hypothetical protein
VASCMFPLSIDLILVGLPCLFLLYTILFFFYSEVCLAFRSGLGRYLGTNLVLFFVVFVYVWSPARFEYGWGVSPHVAKKVSLACYKRCLKLTKSNYYFIGDII